MVLTHMNKHFHDAAYYLKRAGEHAKLGTLETAEPAVRRVEAIRGVEAEPEPSRVEAVLSEVKDLEARAEGEARETFSVVRRRLESLRQTA